MSRKEHHSEMQEMQEFFVIRSVLSGCLQSLHTARDRDEGLLNITVTHILLSALDSDDDETRREAAWMLGRLANPRALDRLVRAMGDNDGWVSFYARDALVRIGLRAVPKLLEALTDDDWRIRMHAAEALGEIKDPAAVKPLAERLTDSEWPVRRASAEALMGLGEDAVDALPAMVRALRAEDNEMVKDILTDAVDALVEICYGGSAMGG